MAETRVPPSTVLLCAGFAFVLASALAYAWGTRAARWLEADARIEHVSVERRFMENRPEPVWTVSVAYAYEAGGAQRVGRAVRFEPHRFEKRREAEAHAARYPVGSTVVARYDPDDPAAAVLEPEPVWWLLAATAVCALAFFSAGLVLRADEAARRAG